MRTASVTSRSEHGAERRTYVLFAVPANMRRLSRSLGEELKHLRVRAGITLRGLAATVEASAAHVSDIEHDRRRPSDELLLRIADALQSVGATFELFDRFATGLDIETREWAASTPGVRKLFRVVRLSGHPPLDLLPGFEQVIRRKKAGTKRNIPMK